MARVMNKQDLAAIDPSLSFQRIKRAAARSAAFNPEDGAADSTGITLTMEAAADATLTRIYTPRPANGAPELTATPLSAVCRFTGGRATIDTNLRYVFPVASIAPATNGQLATFLPATPSYQAWGYEVETVTDATKVQVRMSGFTTHGVKVMVNGSFVSKTATAFQANGSSNYLTLVFTTRELRTITILGMQNDEFVSIAVAPTSKLSKGAGQVDGVVALHAWDSFGEGIGATLPGLEAGTKIMGRRMGWADSRQVSVGQTGFLSTASGTRSTLRQQIPFWFQVNDDIAPERVDVLTIGHGYNDYTNTPEAVQAEAALAFPACRAACPNALIIVFGVHSGKRGPDAQTLSIAAAVKAAFDQWADPRSIYIADADSVSPVMFGTGDSVTTNGSGNTDFNSTNDGHPTTKGHSDYGKRFEAELRSSAALLL